MNYNQIFHEEYRDVVKKIEQPKKRSLINRLRRIYNHIFNKHIMINDLEFCTFCKAAYSNEGTLQEFIDSKMKANYQFVEFINAEDGLQFYVIQSRLTKDLIIAFRGTDEWKDWLTNVQIMQRKRQFETAISYLNPIFKSYPDYHIYFCGHSLGGALAQSMFIHFKKDKKLILKSVITFNSAGVRMKHEPACVDLPIKNYIIDKDLVGSSTGYHFGDTIYLRARNTNKNKLVSKFYTHSLDQFVFKQNGKIDNQIILENENKIEKI